MFSQFFSKIPTPAFARTRTFFSRVESSRFGTKVKAMNAKHPLLTQSSAAAIIAVFGDILVQG